jgi:hypothetical protein
MKLCGYCRRENGDDTVTCCECGTSLDVAEPMPGQKRPPIPWRQVLHDPVMRFRALVVTSTVLYVVYWFHLSVGEPLLSRETLDGLSWHGVGALFLPPMGISWLIFLLSIAVAVGLVGFSSAARVVFVALTVWSVVSCLCGGIQVNNAFGSLLLLLVNMADGAIFYAAYATPLKEKFE